MICFLTSRIDLPGTENMDPANGLIEHLRAYYPEHCHAVYICSDPDNFDKVDSYAVGTARIMENEGFFFETFDTLDNRNPEQAEELIRKADLIILSGGHVPTQNRFFKKIGLREILNDYNGIVIGISAGSMNSADVVYSMPEIEGEAVDPDYRRFLVGLDLTKTMIIPHYYSTMNDTLDGMRVFEDIAYLDSIGKIFIALPDGSYLFIKDDREQIMGDAFRIENGELTQIL